MGVFVDESNCVMCVRCVECAPNTFEMDAEGSGRARVTHQYADSVEDVDWAIVSCPVAAISYRPPEEAGRSEAGRRKLPTFGAPSGGPKVPHGVRLPALKHVAEARAAESLLEPQAQQRMVLAHEEYHPRLAAHASSVRAAVRSRDVGRKRGGAGGELAAIVVGHTDAVPKTAVAQKRFV